MSARNTVSVVPVTPMVKKLIIINLVVWIAGVLILQRFFPEPYLFEWFGLVPSRLMSHFTVWSLFTSMYLHSYDVFHILFNMLLLWWLGAELELYWGRKFFFKYYTVCGVGSALFYTLGVYLYSFATGEVNLLSVPVVGASGAIFGLILAYGIIYSERVIYFFMIFPMKAKYFTLVIGGIEVVTLLNSGFNSRQATLAHLTGALVGLFYLKGGGWVKSFLLQRFRLSKRGRNLKLVVDNDTSQKKPKYWN